MPWFRSQRSPILAALLIAGLLSVGSKAYQAGDTAGWVAGGNQFAKCIANLSLGEPSDQPNACRHISKWPLWNNGMAAVFGLFVENQRYCWQLLNILSFAAYLAIWLSTIRYRNRTQATIATFALLFSPLLFYLNSTFTEIQQGALVTLGLFFLSRRSYRYAASVIFLSILTKESLLPLWGIVFLLLLFQGFGITKRGLSTVSRKQAWLRLMELSPLLCCLMAAVAVSMTFNWLRYDSVVNTVYLAENTQFDMGAGHALANFFWGALSPNGGILVAYGLILACWLVRLRQGTPARVGDNADTRKISWPTVVALIGTGLATTASWWASFGWDAWGYRLFIPYAMPSLYLMFLFTNPSEKNPAEPSIIKDRGGLRLSISAALIAMLSLLGFSYNYSTLDASYSRHSSVIEQSLHSAPPCIEMSEDIRGISPNYWECVSARYRYFPFFKLTPIRSGLREARLLLVVLISVGLYRSIPYRAGPEGQRGSGH